MISLNSSQSGSMKEIPRNLLTLSSFGFSIDHFCFSLRFDASHTSFQISGHKVSALEVVRFLVSLHRTMDIHPVVFILHSESCETCPRIWQFPISINVPIIVEVFLQHYIQGCIWSPGNVAMFQLNRKWFWSGMYSLTLRSTWWR